MWRGVEISSTDEKHKFTDIDGFLQKKYEKSNGANRSSIGAIFAEI